VCATIVLIAYNRPSSGSVLGSAALSIKMNILLYLPGVLVILVKSRGVFQTIYQLTIMLAVQILVALPFLQAYPREYLQNAFEFWRFVPENIFLSRTFALSLLATHLTTLIAFAFFRWCQNDGGALRVLQRGLCRPSLGAGVVPVTADGFCSFKHYYVAAIPLILSFSDIVTILATCNIIGILCARSLHYQFYAWYAQQLPFLAWSTKFPVAIKYLWPLSLWHYVPD
jgi:alpha-1,3-mannosyltransferase